MPAPFLLDTNAYYRLFQYPASANADNFINLLKVGEVASFYISELTSLEIHSVLGKYRRGSSPKKCKCERTIDHEGKLAICSNIWIPEARRRMNPKLYRDIFKLINDIESMVGSIHATTLKIDTQSIAEGQKLLIKYADKYSFNSHDSIIAGTVVAAKASKGLGLTLITSDRGLRAVLNDESIPNLDPSAL